MTTSKPAGRTELQHWHPFSEAFPWNPRLGQLFENMWHAAAHEGYAPGAELEETDDGFVLETGRAGVEKKDITVDVIGRRVAVRGTRVEKERTGVDAPLDAGHRQLRLRGDPAGRGGREGHHRGAHRRGAHDPPAEGGRREDQPGALT